jgi:DNA-binding CsgD family transcriptional regulator
VLSADVYSYNEFNHSTNHAIYKIAPAGFTPIKNAQEILSRFGYQIPMHAHWERGDGRALKISDHLSSHAYKKMDIYNEFYRPMRIPHTIGIALPIHRRLLITIGSHRDRRDFAERECAVLDIIQPHLMQAYTNAQAMTRIRQEQERLQQCLELTQQALIAVTSHLRIEWATACARALLHRYWPAGTRHRDRLPETLRQWVRERDAQMSQTDDLPDRQAPLVIDQRHARLIVRYLRKGMGQFLLFEEQRSEMPTQPLAEFGLSKRETEILGWIVQGKTNPEIGTILGISRRTVQKHLERIYVRLGVENRHAAMTLAFETLRRAI